MNRFAVVLLGFAIVGTMGISGCETTVNEEHRLKCEAKFSDFGKSGVVLEVFSMSYVPGYRVIIRSDTGARISAHTKTSNQHPARGDRWTVVCEPSDTGPDYYLETQISE